MKQLEIPGPAGPLAVTVAGAGPLILCVHGWPELAYSWRHQSAYFSARGYTVAALDVRGYGGSVKPSEVSAYTLPALAADVAAVAAALAPEPAVLFGHDWGAPIAYHTALLYPEQFLAVAGLSVPYSPPSPTPFIEVAEALYADRFFYQNFFQAPGVAEEELEADPEDTLARIYFALSGDAPLDLWLQPKAKAAGLLEALPRPEPFPPWMSAEDLAVYARAFRAGGFRGPLNRYRAQRLDAEQLAPQHGALLPQPSCFIGGERDAVRHFIPGMDLYADPGAGCADFRGATLIPGAGHWVQQEAPGPCNQALEAFLRDL